MARSSAILRAIGCATLGTTLTACFNHAVQPDPQTTPVVSVAHLEPASRFLKKDLLFTHHAQSASGIFKWRIKQNGYRAPFIPIIDEDAYDKIEDKDHLRQYKVISVSSTPSPFDKAPRAETETLLKLWTETDVNPIIAIGNSGNFTCPQKRNYDALRRQILTAYSFSDSVIFTGAVTEDGSVTCYTSENAPDLVYPTAYEQGFCNYYYMTQKEIDDFRISMSQGDQNGIKLQWNTIHDSFVADREAGKLNCDVTGTSFASPNVAGHIATLRSQFPEATDQDIRATALLSASQDDVDVDSGQDRSALTKSMVRNARGLQHSTITGFGIYNPDHHKTLLNTLHTNKQHIEPVILRDTGAKTVDFDFQRNARRVTVQIPDDMATLKTIFEFRVKPQTVSPYEIYQNGLPEDVSLRSPSGTEVKLTAAWDRPTLADPRGMRMVVSTSAFLGESTKGNWTLILPQMYFGTPEVSEARVYIWGTASPAMNTLIQLKP
ncbi:S8 family serine peptidase [Micavibrio aeruginosavorus]|uniref:S8 family serine peptidase n=1 Tax=Micavibrio aeruginosavorus TaxID=349221 RepID=UPI003F4ADD6E